MATKDNKERLFEMMEKVNPDYKRPLNESNSPLEDAPQEEEQEITPEEAKAAAELEKEAETAIPSDEDMQKPVVPENTKGLSLKVTVPTYKKKLADQNIETLKKLAKKLQMPEPEIIQSEPREKRIKNQNNGKMYLIDIYDIEINVEGMFKLPGNYKLVAVVDNVTGGSIEIDENDPVPSEFLKVSGECDLCNQERYRGKNFIIKNGDNGEYSRMGSSCVKKFLGVNVSKYIRALDFMNEFRLRVEEMGDEWGADVEERGGGWGNRMSEANRLVDIPKVISIIHNFIDKDGYEKREWEQETGRQFNYYETPQRSNQGQATADKAEVIVYDDEAFDKYPIDGKYVKEFLTFANTMDPLPPNMIVSKYDGSEYDKNAGFNEYRALVKEMGTKENFRIRETALLASMINFFENDKIRQEKAKKLQGSEWIGTVGEKSKIPYAKLTEARSGEGDYGTWYLWSFIDDNGNSLKKFGTIGEKFLTQQAPEGSEKLFGYHVGDVFAFTATIKKHEEYNGAKTTVLGRLSKL